MHFQWHDRLYESVACNMLLANDIMAKICKLVICPILKYATTPSYFIDKL